MGYSTIRLAEINRLTAALGERLSEILPADQFAINTRDHVIGIHRVGERLGHSVVLTPAFVWLLPLPKTTRLNTMFRACSDQLQSFMTKTLG
jgi:hypothetical protein